MFRWLRWHLAKRRLTARPSHWPVGDTIVWAEAHQAKPDDFPPNEESYGRLASHWNDYASWFVPDFGRFLVSAGEYYRCPIRSVLDLACGTGLLSRQIASRAETVVGLDLSEAMLRQARLLTAESNVRYVRGDFRDFCLEEIFDAAVCRGDSLNYVATPAELADVCRCVQRHLRPGGLFVFDALDDRYFKAVARRKVLLSGRKDAFELYSFYDPVRRVNESRVVFEDHTVERHRRVPIEEADVARACHETKLERVEHFFRGKYCPLRLTVERQFYILRALQEGR